MRADSVQNLLQECVAARDAGLSFPEVWHQILKNNPLVAGYLVQQHRNGKPVLEVPLTTGSRLVCDEAGYSIE